MRVKRWFRSNQLWKVLCLILGTVVCICILPFWFICACIGAALAFAVCVCMNYK